MDRDYTGEELTKWQAGLQASRGNWENLFEEIAIFILPSQRNFEVRLSEGTPRMDQVLDSTAIHAGERLASNLHFLMTNPATPWFRLKFRQEELNDTDEAVEWLQAATEDLKNELNDSNFDDAIGEFYLALPAFGTSVIACEETRPDYGEDDPNKFNGFTFFSHHLARCYGDVAADGRFRDTFLVYELNARQAVERFGTDRVSPKVRDMYEKADFTTKIKFCHAIYKRMYFDTQPEAIDVPAEQRMYASVHYEVGSGEIVESGGYYEKPRFMGRWRKRSDDNYGYGIGEKALPDIKSLNEAKSLWFHTEEKALDPPIFMGANNVVGEIQLGRSGVTYVRDLNQIKFWEPPTSTQMAGQFTFEELRDAIREAFFWDRLDVPPADAGDMTAYEFGKRLERAMQLFGPTIGRLYREVLNDLIQRCFNLMFRKKAFGELPETLRQYADAHIDIEYDSPLSRAQNAEEVNSIDRFVADIASAAAAQMNLGMTDTVADLVDWDEAANLKAKRQGIPEKLLLEDGKVTRMREERKAQQEAQQLTEMAATQAGAARDASAADVTQLRRLA